MTGKDFANYLPTNQGDDLWECKRCGCIARHVRQHNLYCAGAPPFGLNADELRYNTWTGSSEVQILHVPSGHVATGSGGSYRQNTFDALFEIATRLRD